MTDKTETDAIEKAKQEHLAAYGAFTAADDVYDAAKAALDDAAALVDAKAAKLTELLKNKTN